MLTKTEILLVTLMEECDEVSQRVSKAIRFSLDEVQEGQDLTNRERIIYEFNDLLAVMEVLQEEGVFGEILDLVAIKKKKLKIKEYLEYSKEKGTVE